VPYVGVPSAHESTCQDDSERLGEPCGRHLLRQHSYLRLHLSSSIIRDDLFCSISGRSFLHVFISVVFLVGSVELLGFLFPSDLVQPLFWLWAAPPSGVGVILSVYGVKA